MAFNKCLDIDRLEKQIYSYRPSLNKASESRKQEIRQKLNQQLRLNLPQVQLQKYHVHKLLVNIEKNFQKCKDFGIIETSNEAYEAFQKRHQVMDLKPIQLSEQSDEDEEVIRRSSTTLSRQLFSPDRKAQTDIEDSMPLAMRRAPRKRSFDHSSEVCDPALSQSSYSSGHQCSLKVLSSDAPHKSSVTKNESVSAEVTLTIALPCIFGESVERDMNITVDFADLARHVVDRKIRRISDKEEHINISKTGNLMNNRSCDFIEQKVLDSNKFTHDDKKDKYVVSPDDETLSCLMSEVLEPNAVETWRATNALENINNNVGDNYNSKIELQRRMSICNETTQSSALIQCNDDSKKKPKKRAIKAPKNAPYSPKGPAKKRGRKPGSKNNSNRLPNCEKSDLAKYVELFSNNCDLPCTSTSATPSSTMSQMVSSTTQNYEEPEQATNETQTAQITYLLNGEWTNAGICQLISSGNVGNINLDTANITQEDFNLNTPFEDFVNYIDSSNNDVGNNVIARVLDGNNVSTAAHSNTLDVSNIVPLGSANLVDHLRKIPGGKIMNSIPRHPIENQTIIRIEEGNVVMADLQTSYTLNKSNPFALPPPPAHNLVGGVLDLSHKKKDIFIMPHIAEEEDVAANDCFPIDLSMKSDNDAAQHKSEVCNTELIRDQDTAQQKSSECNMQLIQDEEESDDNFIRRLIENSNFDYKIDSTNHHCEPPDRSNLLFEPNGVHSNESFKAALDMPLLDNEVLSAEKLSTSETKENDKSKDTDNIIEILESQVDSLNPPPPMTFIREQDTGDIFSPLKEKKDPVDQTNITNITEHEILEIFSLNGFDDKNRVNSNCDDPGVPPIMSLISKSEDFIKNQTTDNELNYKNLVAENSNVNEVPAAGKQEYNNISELKQDNESWQEITTETSLTEAPNSVETKKSNIKAGEKSRSYEQKLEKISENDTQEKVQHLAQSAMLHNDIQVKDRVFESQQKTEISTDTQKNNITDETIDRLEEENKASDVSNIKEKDEIFVQNGKECLNLVKQDIKSQDCLNVKVLTPPNVEDFKLAEVNENRALDKVGLHAKGLENKVHSQYLNTTNETVLDTKENKEVKTGLEKITEIKENPVIHNSVPEAKGLETKLDNQCFTNINESIQVIHDNSIEHQQENISDEPKCLVKGIESDANEEILKQNIESNKIVESNDNRLLEVVLEKKFARATDDYVNDIGEKIDIEDNDFLQVSETQVSSYNLSTSGKIVTDIEDANQSLEKYHDHQGTITSVNTIERKSPSKNVPKLQIISVVSIDSFAQTNEDDNEFIRRTLKTYVNNKKLAEQAEPKIKHIINSVEKDKNIKKEINAAQINEKCDSNIIQNKNLSPLRCQVTACMDKENDVNIVEECCIKLTENEVKTQSLLDLAVKSEIESTDISDTSTVFKSYHDKLKLHSSNVIHNEDILLNTDELKEEIKTYSENHIIGLLKEEPNIIDLSKSFEIQNTKENQQPQILKNLDSTLVEVEQTNKQFEQTILVKSDGDMLATCAGIEVKELTNAKHISTIETKNEPEAFEISKNKCKEPKNDMLATCAGIEVKEQTNAKHISTIETKNEPEASEISKNKCKEPKNEINDDLKRNLSNDDEKKVLTPEKPSSTHESTLAPPEENKLQSQMKNLTPSKNESVFLSNMSMLDMDEQFHDSCLDFDSHLEDDVLSLATSCFNSPEDDRFECSKIDETDEEEVKPIFINLTDKESPSPKPELFENFVRPQMKLEKSDDITLPIDPLSTITKFKIPKLCAPPNSQSMQKPNEPPPTKRIDLDKITRTVQNVCAVPPLPLQPTALFSASNLNIIVQRNHDLFTIPTTGNAMACNIMLDQKSEIDSFGKGVLAHNPKYAHLSRGQFAGNGGEAVNRGAAVLDIAKLFGPTCLPFLVDKCGVLGSSQHNHQLRDPKIVQIALEGLPKSELNFAYKFMFNHSKLFRRYFYVFCSVYSKQNNRSKLLNMVFDCEKQDNCVLLLRNIFFSLVECGLNKINACRQILSRSRDKSSSTIDVLVGIIFEADWGMFCDYLERFAELSHYSFRINLINEMAARVLRTKDTRLSSVVCKCLLTLNQEDYKLVQRTPDLIALLELMKDGKVC